MKLSESLSPKFMSIFVGEDGSGKTVGYSSWANKDRPMYIFNLDNRLAPIQKMNPSSVDFIEQDPYLSGAISNGLPSYVHLHNKAQEFKKNGPGPYKTIVVDGLTSWGRVSCKYARDIAGQNNKGDKIGVIEIPGLREFNAESNSLKELLDILVILPCDIILTAHLLADDEYKADGTKIVTRSLLSGAKRISAMVGGYFNEKWYFTWEPSIDPKKGPEYVVWTVPYNGMTNKTALDLPPKITWTGKNLYEEVQELLRKKV